MIIIYKYSTEHDITLFAPQETWVVEKQILKSRSINTPWLGKQIQGRVLELDF
ncbi:MAG: hypothetical protein F6K40_37980 [Okeania sp. SIO3I5]|uniref:hypothetical protein n=1 Tax=Okeania sp. SIO3I5 TaxID=2607805 RepID=UPI0013B8680A|nr:hypothetical protein [Okeania sp. SIO3I5]NEQ41671.1 hypothetical protein [Okeania sp. SIO3I5]